ncbi:MAG TPA: TonB-dependent receptor [Longimicrobiales bacterium]|nr:TonB-dependent receptor [Longimicrobiales bacterium]
MRLRRWSVREVAAVVAMAVLLIGGFAGPLAAQESGRAVLRGVVIGEEGSAALPGVLVELVELRRSVRTDAAGAFEFADLAPGTYTVRLSMIGRHVLERTVELDGPGVHDRTLSLVNAPLGLEPILVYMDRTRLVGSGRSSSVLTGSAQAISVETITNRRLMYGDVHALLREVPGLHSQEEDGYGLRPNIGMRGTGSDRSANVTLMEDGVLIAPAPYAAPAAYYFPVAARMEVIEVRKGSSQIRYGPQTIGGALNLVSTTIPSDFSVTVDAAAGTNATRRATVRAGGSGDHFGWLLETYQIATDGFKELDNGGTTGFNIQDYVGKLRVNSRLGQPRYQELELKVGYYDQRSDETYLGLTASDFEENPLRRYAASAQDVMNADHFQLQLRHFAQPTRWLDVTTTAYYNHFARNWYKLDSVMGRSLASVLSDPDANADAVAVLRGGESADNALRVRANNREYFSRGIQAAVGARLSVGVPHEVEVGFRYHEDQEDRFQHDDGYAMRSGRMVLTSSGTPGSQTNRVADASAWSFYVEDRLQLGALTVVPGVRYENIDFVRRDYASGDAVRNEPTATRENGVDVWIPGVGATYDAGGGFRIFGGVHRGFAPPGPGANADTEPESSTNYELGASFTGVATRVQAVGYFSDYTNVLGAETASSGTSGSGDLYNGGAVQAWGVEVTADRDLAARSVSGWSVPVHASYTFTRATFQTSFESAYEPWGTVEKGDELPYIPAHQLFLRGGVEKGRWRGQLTATYTSAARTAAGQGEILEEESTDAFFVLGANAEYALPIGGTSASIYAGVENLANSEYVVARRPAGLRPGLPRTLQIGVRVTR